MEKRFIFRLIVFAHRFYRFRPIAAIQCVPPKKLKSTNLGLGSAEMFGLRPKAICKKLDHFKRKISGTMNS